MRLLSLLFCLCPALSACAAEYLTGITWQEPPVVTPGATAADPPSDAVVLFDGSDLSAWEGAENWKIEGDAMVVGQGGIRTKQSFGDCQLHIEWSAPEKVVGESQGRGNSGVFFLEKYEIQVLDSFENKTYFDGQAGAIYKQTAPMANAMRRPGEWNTYDIVWTSPRFAEDGALESPAYITALHNGVLLLNHFELLGDTPYDRPPTYEAHPPVGKIGLQDHGCPVRYRNIWVREINPPAGQRTREPFLRDGDNEWPVGKEPAAQAH